MSYTPRHHFEILLVDYVEADEVGIELYIDFGWVGVHEQVETLVVCQNLLQTVESFEDDARVLLIVFLCRGEADLVDNRI